MGGIAYTPSGHSLVVTVTVPNDIGPRFYDSHFWFFDRKTGARTADLRTTFGHSAPNKVALSPDGAVVAGNFGSVLGVVSVADGKQVARIKSGTKNITGLAFTPDGSKLVTVSNDTKVRVFDTRTWTETAGFEWKIGKLRCMAVAPDGLRMAAGSDRGKVIVWDVDE
jgi:WD40 repeat protein